MNEFLDQSLSLLYQNEGNIWINRNSKQLRYNSDEKGVSSWISPMSVYDVGENSSNSSKGKIKKGQPVSVGLIDQLDATKKGSGPSAVVVTDPATDKWCIGIAMQPGDVNDEDKIHVLSSGQVEYRITNIANDDYYLPPNHKRSDGSYIFDWTYDDIGKPVYVSNKNKGELTLDLTDATYDGGTIICVGRIADAPLSSEKSSKSQKILIEVQTSGDIRGVIDSTQVTVSMASQNSTLVFSSGADRLLFVKVVNNKGYFITSKSDLNTSNQPIGAIVVTPKKSNNSYTVDLSEYSLKDIVVTRLGVLNGNFNIEESNIGKTLYLNTKSNSADTDSTSLGYYSDSDTIEYKVGAALDTDRILVDCRYLKDYTKFSMIGTIKPVYESGLLDTGYALIDPSITHTVYNDASGIDWTELIKACYGKDVFLFSKDGKTYSRVNEKTVNNAVWTLNGDADYNRKATNKILDPVNNTYFKFRDMYYTLTKDGATKTCACQIKYSKEGSEEESQAYVWPEQAYELTLESKNNGNKNNIASGKTDAEKVIDTSKKPRLNITSLVKVGQIIDHNDYDIESYDIVLQYFADNKTQYLAPGFHVYQKDGTTCYYGYEWYLYYDKDTTKNTYLYMKLQPDNMQAGEIAYGPAQSISNIFTDTTDFIVVVRRRPTQFNSFYLNQFPESNPWTPLQDSSGNLRIKGDKVYFSSSMESNLDTSSSASTGFTSDGSSGYIELGKTDDGAEVNFVINGDTSNSSPVLKQTLTYKGATDKQIIWTYDFSGSKPSANVNAILPASVYFNSYGYTIKNTDVVNALNILRQYQSKLLFEESSNSTAYYYGARSDTQLSALRTVDLKDNSNDEIESGSDKLYLNTATDDASKQAANALYASDSTVNFLTNIGLLNDAAVAAENRLYKLERAIYGSDASSISSAYNTESINRFFGDAGLLRIYSWLDKLQIFKTSNDELKNVYKDVNSGDYTIRTKDYVSSILYGYFIDNFGKYTSKDDFKDAIESFYSKSLIEFLRSGNSSNLRELWFFYNALSVKKTALNAECMSLQGGLDSLGFKADKDALTEGYFLTGDSVIPSIVAKITLLKHSQYEDKDFFSNDSSFAGTLLEWPIYKNPNVAGPLDPETAFFDSNIVGLSDASIVKKTGSALIPEVNTDNTYYSSFPAQSVDGWLLDAFVKLSYLRSLFDFDHTMYTSGVLYMPYLYASVDESETALHVIKYTTEDMVHLNDFTATYNTYSAFQFFNGKIIKAFRQLIAKVRDQLVFTNLSTMSSVNTSVSGNFANGEYSGSNAQPAIVNVNSTALHNANQILLMRYLDWMSSQEAAMLDQIINFPAEVPDGSTVEPDTCDDIIETAKNYNDFIDTLALGYFDDERKVSGNSIFAGMALTKVKITRGNETVVNAFETSKYIKNSDNETEVVDSNYRLDKTSETLIATRTFSVCEFAYDAASNKFNKVKFNPQLSKLTVDATTQKPAVVQLIKDSYTRYHEALEEQNPLTTPTDIKELEGTGGADFWEKALTRYSCKLSTDTETTNALFTKVVNTSSKDIIIQNAFDLTAVLGNGHYLYQNWINDSKYADYARKSSEDNKKNETLRKLLLNDYPFYEGVGERIDAYSTASELKNYKFKVLFRQNKSRVVNTSSDPHFWSQLGFGENSDYDWTRFVKRPLIGNSVQISSNDKVATKVADNFKTNNGNAAATYAIDSSVKIGDEYITRFDGTDPIYVKYYEQNIPTDTEYFTMSTTHLASSIADDSFLLIEQNTYDFWKSYIRQKSKSESEDEQNAQVNVDDSKTVSYDIVQTRPNDYIEDYVLTVFIYGKNAYRKQVTDIFRSDKNSSIAYSLTICSSSFTNFALTKTSILAPNRTNAEFDENGNFIRYTTSGLEMYGVDILQYTFKSYDGKSNILNNFGSSDSTLSTALLVSGFSQSDKVLMSSRGFKDVKISIEANFHIKNDNNTTIKVKDNKNEGKEVDFTIPTIKVYSDMLKATTVTQNGYHVDSNNNEILNEPKFTAKGYSISDTLQEGTAESIDENVALDKDALVYGKAYGTAVRRENKELKNALIDFAQKERTTYYDRTAKNNSSLKVAIDNISYLKSNTDAERNAFNSLVSSFNALTDRVNSLTNVINSMSNMLVVLATSDSDTVRIDNGCYFNFLEDDYQLTSNMIKGNGVLYIAKNGVNMYELPFTYESTRIVTTDTVDGQRVSTTTGASIKLTIPDVPCMSDSSLTETIYCDIDYDTDDLTFKVDEHRKSSTGSKLIDLETILSDLNDYTFTKIDDKPTMTVLNDSNSSSIVKSEINPGIKFTNTYWSTVYNLSKSNAVDKIAVDTIKDPLAEVDEVEEASTFNTDYNYEQQSAYENADITEFDNKVTEVESMTYDKAYYKRHAVKTYFAVGTLNTMKKDVYLHSYYLGNNANKNTVAVFPTDSEGKISFSGANKQIDLVNSTWKFSEDAFITGQQIPEPDVFYKLTYDDLMRLFKLSYGNSPDSFNAAALDTEITDEGAFDKEYQFTLSKKVYITYGSDKYYVSGITLHIANNVKNAQVIGISSCKIGSINPQTMLFYAGSSGLYENFLFSLTLSCMQTNEEYVPAKVLLNVPQIGYFNKNGILQELETRANDSVMKLDTVIDSVDFMKYIIKHSTLCVLDRDYADKDTEPGTDDNVVLVGYRLQAAISDASYDQIKNAYTSISDVIDSLVIEFEDS